MNYNPYSDMNSILKYKQKWVDADTAGDTTGKNNAATKAQEHYQSLRDNGYGSQAQRLYDSGLQESKNYVSDFMAKTGRSQIRPYLYGKASQYGLTQADIDKALSFDTTTGEVSLGGKNIGKAPAISSDGYSYWDSSVLDNAWNDYVQSAGLSKNTMKDSVQRATDNLLKMGEGWNDTYKQDYSDYMNIVKQDPLASDTAKRILAQYGLMGYTGRQNALANGAASNGGNVDSYSAANAMRQQAALNTMGAQTAAQIALDAYNSKVQAAAGSSAKLEGARQLLAQLGVNINDAVANNETMLNGEVDRSEKVKNGEVDRNETILNGKMNRAAQEADITGVQPRYINNRQNRYFDENGNLKDAAGTNFADIVYALRGELENTTDETRRKEIEQNIEEALAAGNYKVTMPEYSQYATEWARQFPTAGAFTAKPTEDARQFNVQSADAKEIANMGYQHDMDKANLDAENQRKQSELEADLQMKLDNNTTNNTIRENAAANNIGTSGTSGAGAIDADSVKITNKINLEGKYDVGGHYYTADEIIDGINNGTLYYEDEGNGKISIHHMIEGAGKTISNGLQDMFTNALRKSK